MAGTNIKIGGVSGGSGSGNPSEAPVQERFETGRIIFNDMLSTTTSHVPLLPHALLSGALVVQGERHLFDSDKAKSVFPIAASNTNANSGMSVYGSFGFSLDQSSYGKCIVKFEDMGSDVENDKLRFAFGFNSSNNFTIGNAGIMFKIIGREIQTSRRAGLSGASSTINTALTPFAQYGKFLVFEIIYTAQSEVIMKISDLDDGTIYFEETYTTDVPNTTTLTSGDQVNCYASATWTTAGSPSFPPFVVFDLVGFYAG